MEELFATVFTSSLVVQRSSSESFLQCRKTVKIPWKQVGAAWGIEKTLPTKGSNDTWTIYTSKNLLFILAPFNTQTYSYPPTVFTSYYVCSPYRHKLDHSFQLSAGITPEPYAWSGSYITKWCKDGSHIKPMSFMSYYFKICEEIKEGKLIFCLPLVYFIN